MVGEHIPGRHVDGCAVKRKSCLETVGVVV